MKSLAQTKEFTNEVVTELKKVTWPDWPQLRSVTVVVIVFSIIVALIIWLMDVGVRAVVRVIMDLFAA